MFCLQQRVFAWQKVQAKQKNFLLFVLEFILAYPFYPLFVPNLVGVPTACRVWSIHYNTKECGRIDKRKWEWSLYKEATPFPIRWFSNGDLLLNSDRSLMSFLTETKRRVRHATDSFHTYVLDNSLFKNYFVVYLWQHSYLTILVLKPAYNIKTKNAKCWNYVPQLVGQG